MRRIPSASFGVVVRVFALALFGCQSLAEQASGCQIVAALERCSLRSSELGAVLAPQHDGQTSAYNQLVVDGGFPLDVNRSRSSTAVGGSSAPAERLVFLAYLTSILACTFTHSLSYTSPTTCLCSQESLDEDLLVELVGVVVILGECVRAPVFLPEGVERLRVGGCCVGWLVLTLALSVQIALGAHLVDWVAVQVPGLDLQAAHNTVALIIGALAAATHHLLFTGWYLQWFSESSVYLLALLLQILLSCSTAIIYASAMRQLANLHFARHRLAQLSRTPPRARFC